MLNYSFVLQHRCLVDLIKTIGRWYLLNSFVKSVKEWIDSIVWLVPTWIDFSGWILFQVLRRSKRGALVLASKDISVSLSSDFNEKEGPHIKSEEPSLWLCSCHHLCPLCLYCNINVYSNTSLDKNSKLSTRFYEYQMMQQYHLPKIWSLSSQQV